MNTRNSDSITAQRAGAFQSSVVDPKGGGAVWVIGLDSSRQDVGRFLWDIPEEILDQGGNAAHYASFICSATHVSSRVSGISVLIPVIEIASPQSAYSVASATSTQRM